MTPTVSTIAATITSIPSWCPIWQHKCKKNCKAMNNGECTIIQAMIRSYQPPVPIEPYLWDIEKLYCDQSVIYTNNTNQHTE